MTLLLKTWSFWLLESEHGPDMQSVQLFKSGHGTNMQIFGILKFDTVSVDL